ncbi:MAG TPA: hypothetical protein VFK09_13040, partial [Gemmatimonadales bacterium]|nr:hypothetical protein [Gemmatimonadales bacterium]
LEHATRVIDLANELERRLDTGVGRQGSPVRQTRLNWLMRGQLYAAVGGQAAALRRIWDGARDAGRAAATPEDGVALWTSGGAAALGLLTLPEPDTAAYAEYRRLTGRPAQREVQALLALARGDSGAARRALAAPEPPWRGSEEPFPVWVRPLAALAHFRIGEYEAALRAVDEFDPFAFSTSDFDMRWGLLPRVRLLRAAAYERLSRPDEARREYRLVLEQWRAADPSLRPYLNEAGRELARLGEPAERLSALGYQLSATPGVRGGRCEPPPPVGGRQQP